MAVRFSKQSSNQLFSGAIVVPIFSYSEVLLGLTDSRILKANLSWSPTRTKFFQLIASLSVVLPQLNLTKLSSVFSELAQKER